MKTQLIDQGELDLGQLDEEEKSLRERLALLEESRRRIMAERNEESMTLPPSELVQNADKRKAHDELVSRKQDRNIRREHRSGIMLLVLLITASITLIWWALKLMNR